MLHSELIKIRSTRVAAGLWVAAVVVAAVGAFTTSSSMAGADLRGALRTQEFFLLASVNLSVFALLVGVRSFTDDFRHGTIVWSLLSIRRRSLLVGAKALVAGAWCGGMAVTAQIALAATAIPVAAAKHGQLTIGPADVAAAVGLTLSTSLWATIGVAVGALVRHQVGAVALVLVWVLAVENVGASLLHGGGALLPGQAGHSLALAEAATHALPATAGGVLLLGYALAATVLAGVSLTRRPVVIGW